MTGPLFQPPAEADEKPEGDSTTEEKAPRADKSDSDDAWETSPGKGGKAAVLADLAAAKDKAKAAEKELAKYRKAEQDQADANKSEAEKRAAAEQRAADAELRATRLEVAHEKGLTPAQAKRLVGTTREELAADADEILKDFPAIPAKPAAPKPDPSQGARGETKNRPTSLAAAVASHYAKPS